VMFSMMAFATLYVEHTNRGAQSAQDSGFNCLHCAGCDLRLMLHMKKHKETLRQ
jgi:hypothetical protein